MAVCMICDKGTMHGQNIRHKHEGKWALKAQKTKRPWKTNTRKVKLVSDTGETVSVVMCMKCYKKYRNVGI